MIDAPDDPAAPGAIPTVEVTSEDALWAWLEAHHGWQSVWLVTWKAAHRDKYLSRAQVLDALVAYGWTDGRRKVLDEDRTMQLISPRRQGVWARSYKDRAARLVAEGRMRPPGQAALDEAKRSGTWDASDPVDDLVVPNDLGAALDQDDGRAWFEGAAPSYRRNVLRYIAQAKRADTSARRIAQVAAHAARGEKLLHY